MHFKKSLLFMVFTFCYLLSYGIEADTTKPEMKVVETLPLYSHNCPIENYDERYQCSLKSLLEELYADLEYPQIARENGVEGIVVIQFVVEKDGTLSEFVIAKNPGSGLGQASLKAVKGLKHKWEPGTQRGEPCRVQFSLPIKFSLESRKKKKRKNRRNKN